MNGKHVTMFEFVIFFNFQKNFWQGSRCPKVGDFLYVHQRDLISKLKPKNLLLQLLLGSAKKMRISTGLLLGDSISGTETPIPYSEIHYF